MNEQANSLRALIQTLPVSSKSKYQFILSSTTESDGWQPICKLTKSELTTKTELILQKYKDVNLSWIPNSFQPFKAGATLDVLGFINMLYLDFDVEKNGKTKALEQPRILQYFKSINFLPTYMIDSGHGFYVYWVLQDGLHVTRKNIWAVKRLSEGVKAVVRELKGAGFEYVDTNVTNLNHSMRLPGSYNFKNEKDIRQVKIVWQSKVTYQYENVYSKLTELAKNQKVNTTYDKDPVDKGFSKKAFSPKKDKVAGNEKNSALVENGKQHNKAQNRLFLADFIQLSKLRGVRIDGNRHDLLIQAYIRGAHDLHRFNEKLGYPLDENEVAGLQRSMDNYQKQGKLYQPKKAETLVQELGVNEEEIRSMSVLVPKRIAVKRANFRTKLKQLINTEFKKKIKLCEVLVVKKSRTLSAKKLAKQLNVSPRTVQEDKNMDINELAEFAIISSHETLCLVNKAIKEGIIDGEKMKLEIDLVGQDVESIKNETKKQTLKKLKDYQKQADKYALMNKRFDRK